ncbi:MAG: hypothetical protein GY866_39025 [Proteobacteria bacterium]|nr:hypothetical protein [Pseudomonadota bacterium]
MSAKNRALTVAIFILLMACSSGAEKAGKPESSAPPKAVESESDAPAVASESKEAAPSSAPMYDASGPCWTKENADKACEQPEGAAEKWEFFVISQDSTAKDPSQTDAEKISLKRTINLQISEYYNTQIKSKESVISECRAKTNETTRCNEILKSEAAFRSESTLTGVLYDWHLQKGIRLWVRAKAAKLKLETDLKESASYTEDSLNNWDNIDKECQKPLDPKYKNVDVDFFPDCRKPESELFRFLSFDGPRPYRLGNTGQRNAELLLHWTCINIDPSSKDTKRKSIEAIKKAYIKKLNEYNLLDDEMRDKRTWWLSSLIPKNREEKERRKSKIKKYKQDKTGKWHEGQISYREEYEIRRGCARQLKAKHKNIVRGITNKAEHLDNLKEYKRQLLEEKGELAELLRSTKADFNTQKGEQNRYFVGLVYSTKSFSIPQVEKDFKTVLSKIFTREKIRSSSDYSNSQRTSYQIEQDTKHANEIEHIEKITRFQYTKNGEETVLKITPILVAVPKAFSHKNTSQDIFNSESSHLREIIDDNRRDLKIKNPTFLFFDKSEEAHKWLEKEFDGLEGYTALKDNKEFYKAVSDLLKDMDSRNHFSDEGEKHLKNAEKNLIDRLQKSIGKNRKKTKDLDIALIQTSNKLKSDRADKENIERYLWQSFKTNYQVTRDGLSEHSQFSFIPYVKEVRIEWEESKNETMKENFRDMIEKGIAKAMEASAKLKRSQTETSYRETDGAVSSEKTEASQAIHPEAIQTLYFYKDEGERLKIGLNLLYRRKEKTPEIIQMNLCNKSDPKKDYLCRSDEEEAGGGLMSKSLAESCPDKKTRDECILDMQINNLKWEIEGNDMINDKIGRCKQEGLKAIEIHKIENKSKEKYIKELRALRDAGLNNIAYCDTDFEPDLKRIKRELELCSDKEFAWVSWKKYKDDNHTRGEYNNYLKNLRDEGKEMTAACTIATELDNLGKLEDAYLDCTEREDSGWEIRGQADKESNRKYASYLKDLYSDKQAEKQDECPSAITMLTENSFEDSDGKTWKFLKKRMRFNLAKREAAGEWRLATADELKTLFGVLSPFDIDQNKLPQDSWVAGKVRLRKARVAHFNNGSPTIKKIKSNKNRYLYLIKKE